MPELPEVETVLQGIKPLVEHQVIRGIVIRQPKLRWDVPKGLQRKLLNQKIIKLERRGKYILFHLQLGTLLLHFGMSGSLTVLSKLIDPKKHDHIDLLFDDFYLRYTDPRRFGALLYTEGDPQDHPLLAKLGIEPLTKAFNGEYLYRKARSRKLSIKQFIMNHQIVVGVGNIYAAEALFLAKLNPLTPANQISKVQYQQLATAIKQVLKEAIKKGGTTLKDFKNSEGKMGYFKQKLNVYDREGLPCVNCQQPLKAIRIQNRATVFCSTCQN
jgi:formamidopyrimidine-DNA glycosylase